MASIDLESTTEDFTYLKILNIENEIVNIIKIQMEDIKKYDQDNLFLEYVNNEYFQGQMTFAFLKYMNKQISYGIDKYVFPKGKHLNVIGFEKNKYCNRGC